MTRHSESENQQNRTPENRDLTAVPPEIRPHVFKPGQSGNPGGRPKKLTRHLERLLDQKDEKGRTYAERLVESVVKRAIKRSDSALKEIWERTEGKVPQAVTGADGGPVQFQVVVVQANLPHDAVLDLMDDGEIVDEK